MKTRWEICIEFVLVRETEYNRDGTVKVERDPNDPGGTTKYGIDQRDHPHVDVAHLTRAEAEEIYRENEWTRCRCGELKAPWDLAVFDSAVNPGIGWTIPHLQEVAGVKMDGFVGPKTIAAVNALPLEKVNVFLAKREAYYNGLPAKKNGRPFRDRFIAGWLSRVVELRRATASLA